MNKIKPFIINNDIKYIEYETGLRTGDLCIAKHECGAITDNLLFIYNGNYIYSYYNNAYFALEDSDNSFSEKIKTILSIIDMEILKRQEQSIDDKIKNLDTLNKMQKQMIKKKH